MAFRPNRRQLALAALAALALLGLAAALWPHRAEAGAALQDAVRLLQDHLRSIPPALFALTLGAVFAIPLPCAPFIALAGLIHGVLLGLAMTAFAFVESYVISHILAVYLCHRPLMGWLQRRGHRLPQFSPAQYWQATLLIRSTPGIPLIVQNYILSLGGIPLRILVPGSLPPNMLGATGIILATGSLASGNWTLVITGILLLVAAAIALRMIHTAWAKRRAAASPSAL